MDVICRVCGEQWEWDDQDREDYERLLRGEGCPHCDGRPLCGRCRHSWRWHHSILRPDFVGCFADLWPTQGLEIRCDCAGYEPAPTHDEEHYRSIEGEDAETWMEVR